MQEVSHIELSDLSIYELLKSGLNPAEICKKYEVNKKTLQHYLQRLKNAQLVKKVGYGTWEIQKPWPNKVSRSLKKNQVTTKVGTKQLKKNYLKTDNVRGHAFQFKLHIPKNLRNWNKRKEILQKLNVDFKELKVPKDTIRINLEGRKVWLTNKSIIIYEKESFISEKANTAQSMAISHFLTMIKKLERMIKADFSKGGQYKFKVTRQHYALVKNALAKQYNKEGKKLNCYTSEGLWLIIDNSFNLDETETVHARTAVTDNEKVQAFFNGLKAVEGYTPQLILNAVGQNATNLLNYSKNLAAHVDSIKTLGIQVAGFVEEVKRLNHAIEKLESYQK